MVVLPDPKIENIQSGFKWFRSSVPRLFSVVDTSICITEQRTSHWLVTCRTKCTLDVPEVKSIMQKALGAVCRILTTKRLISAHGEKWAIGVAPIKSRRRTWIDYIPCLTITNSKIRYTEAKDIKTPDVQRNKIDFTKIKTRECHLIGSDGKKYSIDSECIPRKLVYGERDITHKVFGKSRMNNHFKRVLEKGIDKPLIWVKNSKDVTFKKQTCSATPPSTVVTPPVRTSHDRVIPNRSSVEIPYSYQPVERKYMLSKLRDRTIFRHVEEFVALKQFLPCRKPSSTYEYKVPFPRLEYLNVLASNGLPVDETLEKLFHEYCIEAGISGVEVESEFEQIRKRFCRFL